MANKLLKNKKGFLGGADSFIFGMVGFFILILILVALIPIERGDVTVNQTLASLNSVQNTTLAKFVTDENNTVITNIVYSMLNFVIYSAFEVTKLGMDYGLSHPEVVNPVTLLWLIIISLAIPIVFYVIKIGALVFILIKEIFQSFADKRKLRKLEQIRNGVTQ